MVFVRDTWTHISVGKHMIINYQNNYSHLIMEIVILNQMILNELLLLDENTWNNTTVF